MNAPITPLTEQEYSEDAVSEKHLHEAPTVISAALPPNQIAQSNRRWGALLHVAVLPLVVGVSILWVEGSFSMATFRDAWLVMAVLATAYVAAWALSSSFERFPFINQFEAALYSVGLTLVPAGTLLYALPVSPSRNLALAASAGSIVWYLADKCFRRFRASSLLVLPGGTSNRLLQMRSLLQSEPAYDQTASQGDGAPPLVRRTVDGIVTDLHVPMNGQQRIIASNSMKGLPVYHAAFIYELLTGRVMLDASCTNSVQGFTSRRFYSVLKRAADVLVVLVTLPVTLPLMALTALAIRLESKGPVLFWQTRVGRNGKPFKMVKFRSMYAENEGEHTARFAGESDDRITRIGQFIRTYRIDELPQFWNVLKGEMSLIGPRPEQVDFVRSYRQSIPHYAQRHSVRPGITGWAQVRHGYAADDEETRRKLEHDLYYVKHLSPVLDLLICYLTLKTICTGFGAR